MFKKCFRKRSKLWSAILQEKMILGEQTTKYSFVNLGTEFSRKIYLYHLTMTSLKVNLWLCLFKSIFSRQWRRNSSEVKFREILVYRKTITFQLLLSNHSFLLNLLRQVKMFNYKSGQSLALAIPGMLRFLYWIQQIYDQN